VIGCLQVSEQPIVGHNLWVFMYPLPLQKIILFVSGTIYIASQESSVLKAGSPQT
jgi:hypothetical protein